jgi:hypothetical protein
MNKSDSGVKGLVGDKQNKLSSRFYVILQGDNRKGLRRRERREGAMGISWRVLQVEGAAGMKAGTSLGTSGRARWQETSKQERVIRRETGGKWGLGQIIWGHISYCFVSGCCTFETFSKDPQLPCE